MNIVYHNCLDSKIRTYENYIYIKHENNFSDFDWIASLNNKVNMKLLMCIGTTPWSRVRRFEVQLHAFCLGTILRLIFRFALCRSSQGRTPWNAFGRRFYGVQKRYGCKKKYSCSCWERYLFTKLVLRHFTDWSNLTYYFHNKRDFQEVSYFRIQLQRDKSICNIVIL